jgi:hypothetical protein
MTNSYKELGLFLCVVLSFPHNRWLFFVEIIFPLVG